jgi:hypothetical protein
MEGTSADLSLGYEGDLCLSKEEEDWEDQYRYLLRFSQDGADLLLSSLKRRLGRKKTKVKEE